MSLRNRCPALFLGLVFITASIAGQAEEPPREAEQTVARSEAVDALQSFQKDPLHNLEAASVFMTYVKEDGDVHVSMTDKLVPWMRPERPMPMRARALLLSAFVAGNFDSQLKDETQLDDTVAGLSYTVEVYELLKQEDPSLNVPELETLLEAKQNDDLQNAVQAMINDANPSYED
ncbi:MAG: hypothetical protein U5P41_06265 [Gammaproteobacteria bacterium]|nr:hypothetical protein [Gammaproteobacteria bacterium]